jgi:hypothetical protein
MEHPMEYHGKPCTLCGEFINSLAGNPSLWGVLLPRHGGNGKLFVYHFGCVSDAIARLNTHSYPDTWLDTVIKERDDNEERLTQLAEAVGEYFGVPVGEWSSANDPVTVALEILAGGYKTDRWLPK